jgi:Flp pilus assembly protein TadB
VALLMLLQVLLLLMWVRRTVEKEPMSSFNLALASQAVVLCSMAAADGVPIQLAMAAVVSSHAAPVPSLLATADP